MIQTIVIICLVASAAIGAAEWIDARYVYYTIESYPFLRGFAANTIAFAIVVPFGIWFLLYLARRQERKKLARNK